MLDITDLSVVIRRPGRRVAALSNVSFAVAPGEVVGLVGESGGGKSMVARAIVGMLPPGSEATGRVGFDGADVLRMDAAALASHRGRGAAICFQNPSTKPTTNNTTMIAIMVVQLSIAMVPFNFVRT